MEADELARFQAALLEVLASAPDPASALEALRALPEAAAVSAWIESLEPRGIETGMELVRRWGAREWQPREGHMRGVVLDEVGAPLAERELPIPEPGPGQVRVRVHASGLCGTDVHLWQGRFRVPLPIVPGHEPAGVVDAVGEGAALAVGERVGVPWLQAGCGACQACARGKSKYCRRQRNWIVNGGGFAEHVIAEASGCVRIPDALSFEEAAPLFCAGFTAMSGYRRARARREERVAVLGLGGLGHLAVQIARAHGHEVIAMTRARSKVRDALSMGAGEVLMVREHAGRELAAMGGADVVISTTSDARAAGEVALGLRDEGRLVLVGKGEGPGPIDADALVNKQASVLGAMQDERADLADLLELAARGEVRPWIEPYRLGQAQRALMRAAEGRTRYRAVLIA